MTTRTKPKAATPADIKRGVKAYQQRMTPMTGAEADAILATNGIPPKPEAQGCGCRIDWDGAKARINICATHAYQSPVSRTLAADTSDAYRAENSSREAGLTADGEATPRGDNPPPFWERHGNDIGFAIVAALIIVCSPVLAAVFSDLFAATAIQFWPVAQALAKAWIG